MVPRDDDLTECQKLESRLNHYEHRIDQSRQFLVYSEEAIKILKARIRQINKVIQDKERAERLFTKDDIPAPPKFGGSPKGGGLGAAALEFALTLIQEAIEMKQQQDENRETYYQSEYWALTAAQLAEVKKVVQAEIDKLVAESRAASERIADLQDKLPQVRARYDRRCRRVGDAQQSSGGGARRPS